jgi:hypothetical protein
LAFLKQSGKDSAISKHKLKKPEALLLNSYNLRNVVNNSLSLSDVLTFYFGSAVPRPDILARRRCPVAEGEGRIGDMRNALPHRLHQNFTARHEFDVYANVNIL